MKSGKRSGTYNEMINKLVHIREDLSILITQLQSWSNRVSAVQLQKALHGKTKEKKLQINVIVSGELKCEHKQVILYSPAAAVHNTLKLRVRINNFPCQACEI